MLKFPMLGTVVAIFFTIKISAAIRYYPDAEYSEQNKTYDFIIIGASPSGLVAANRLTEISGWDVLLLEAGSEAGLITEIPFLCGALAFTDYNWGYKAEQQDGFCRGCIDKRIDYPHGKAFGGGTVINYMIFVRGNRRDYDRWAAMGNPGWSYDDVFPYFLKSEDAVIDDPDPGYHNTGGPLAIRNVDYKSEVSRAFIQAAQEAGHKSVDYNGKDQMGVSFVQSTTKRGRRFSAEKGFLRPVRHRKNLTILQKARVVKILIDPVTKKAYGVQFARNKKYYTVLAKKEVILSAGSLNSPQLLMLSGIGPKDHLEELDIPVIQDLPVGKKMYDHAAFMGMTFQVNESIVLDQDRALLDPVAYIQWLADGSSIFGSIGGVEGLLYTQTNASKDPDPEYPDIELIIIGGGVSTDHGLVYRRIFNIPQEIYDVVWKPLENKYIYQVMPMLVHPKSTGYIKLKSKNPFHWPKFYANYFSDPENQDIKTFIAALREVQRINQFPALQKYGATLVTTPIPGCEHEEFNSDEYWECVLRTIINSLYHQVSTCKMGPETDPEAVVDASLKVHGIEGLRVVDTSVIPLPPTAHTMGPAYVIGEKASDMIKQYWGQKT